jgi:hypothetical protein
LKTILREFTRIVALLLPIVATAQEPSPPAAQSSVSVSGLTRPRADLDGGGNFDASAIRASATLGGRVAPRMSAAIGVKYAYEDWHFATPGAFGPVAPWNAIQAPSIDLNLSYQWSDKVVLFVAPAVGWTYETGASSGDALSYGAAFGMSYSHSPTLMVGVGAGVFRQIDQTRVFPLVLVNWQITDQWSLSNPLNAGPTGGPGIELAYAISERWEVGLGAAFRETRFRLRTDGPTPNGIGVEKGVPLFARLTYAPSPRSKIDFFAGAVVGGELRLLDSSGSTISESDFKTAPLLGISASLEF